MCVLLTIRNFVFSDPSCRILAEFLGSECQRHQVKHIGSLEAITVDPLET